MGNFLSDLFFDAEQIFGIEPNGPKNRSLYKPGLDPTSLQQIKNSSIVLWVNDINEDTFGMLRGNYYLKENIIQTKILNILKGDNYKRNAQLFVKKFYTKIVIKDNSAYCNKLTKINNNIIKGCGMTGELGTPGKMGIPYSFVCKIKNKRETIPFVIKDTPFKKTIIGIASIQSPKHVIHDNSCSISIKPNKPNKTFSGTGINNNFKHNTSGGVALGLNTPIPVMAVLNPQRADAQKKYEIVPYPDGSNMEILKKQFCECDLVTDAEEFIFLDAFGQQTLVGNIINQILWVDETYGRCGNSTYFFDSFYCTQNNELDGWNLMSDCDEGELTSLLLFKYDKSYIKKRKKQKKQSGGTALGLNTIQPVNAVINPIPERPLEQDDDELSNLNDIDIMIILAQIFFSLNILQKNFEFIHGDLKGKNIFIRTTTPEEKKDGIEYKNIKFGNETVNFRIFNMKYTVCLADFDKSVITYKKIRFFNFPVKRIFFGKKSIESSIKKTVRTRGRYLIDKYNGKYYYKLPNYKIYNAEQIFALLRFTGVKYFDSLDLYVLLSSLMLHNKFYRMTQKKKDYRLLRGLIKKAFFIDTDDYNKYMLYFRKIPRSVKNIKVESLGKTIAPYKDTKLSCKVMDDIIQYYYKNIKKFNGNIETF